MTASRQKASPDRVLHEGRYGVWPILTMHRIRPTIRRAWLSIPKGVDGKKDWMFGDVYRVSVGPQGTVRIHFGAPYWERPLWPETARQFALDVEAITTASLLRDRDRRRARRAKGRQS